MRADEADAVFTLEQQALAAVNGPFVQFTGRVLIGNGANGTATNPDGRAGGWLYGNGGNGYSSTVAGGAGGAGPEHRRGGPTLPWPGPIW